MLYEQGIIAVESAQLRQNRLQDCVLDLVTDELELINRVVDVICDLDPDILTGWELQNGSWGYLNARGDSHGECQPELTMSFYLAQTLMGG